MHSLLNFWILIIAFVLGVIGRGDLGFSISTRKLDGNCKSTQDYLDDISLISSYSKFIRIFSISDCNSMKNIMPAIIPSGMKIILGIWPGGVDTAQFNDQLSLLKEIPQEHVPYIYAISVGSEVLYRKDYSDDVLLSQITTVRNLLNQMNFQTIKVGMADTWNVFADGTANRIIGALDIAFVNSFPYWQGFAVEHSTYTFFADISNTFNVIRSINHNVEIWIGETGWPTDGVPYGAAIPNVENAAYFWANVICSSLFNDLSVLVFELMDEPWKGDAVGLSGQSSNVEKFWGVFAIDRKQKYSLECPKESERVIPSINSKVITSSDSGNKDNGESKVDSGNTDNGESNVDSGNTDNGGSNVDSGNTDNSGSNVDFGNIDNGESNVDFGNIDNGESNVDSGNADHDSLDDNFHDSLTDIKEPNMSSRISFSLKNAFYLSFTAFLFLFFFY
ncbi:hypothetical protein T552_04075 [Pneumocystis carinii B80]|uniref:glucan 1,3-beta-glucosidase n=1 Tax=Pneumocystis carinii (strain B80) TaxID=1408658 RepID=A0A0W4ZP80_PNEC8|nr:hypothetical protein T552_04075 [Pneumocystis carinii B80]KTW30166.1 hypothetical protein T552_04075 [Pneumocystis carinii B80]